MPTQKRKKTINQPHATSSLNLPRDEKIPPIVGIGASAGGLETLEQFFKVMPTNTGMSFVIVTHLDPHHKSLLLH